MSNFLSVCEEVMSQNTETRDNYLSGDGTVGVSTGVSSDNDVHKNWL